jgi:hypothetical protein
MPVPHNFLLPIPTAAALVLTFRHVTFSSGKSTSTKPYGFNQMLPFSFTYPSGGSRH